ncbi:MAG: hypothetical protein RLZZ428_983 [Pseudomonadota bacterium]|jgi:uncharacterized protein
MVLKLIIFAILALLIYKFLGGKLPKIKTSVEKKLEDDTLVECTTCHTYVTAKESMIVSGKFYCSKECLPR